MRGAPLRLGTCRNSPRGLHWAPTITERDPVSGLMRTTRACAYCHTVYPLGPSDEAPVAVEIRAAFLASQWDPNDGSWDGFVSLGMCSPEAEHAPLIEADIASGRKYQRDLDDYYAGHLARVIATHGEDQ